MSGAIATLVPVFFPAIMLQITGQTDVGVIAELGSVLQASFLGGWIVGGVMLGMAADKYGRTRVLCTSLAIALVATVCMANMHSLSGLTICRCIAGIGVGGVMVISTTIGAEVLTNTTRMWLMGVLANSYAFGIIGMGAAQGMVHDWTVMANGLAVFAILIPLLLVVARNLSAKNVGDIVQEDKAKDIRTAMQLSRRDIIIGSLMFGSMLICLWATFSWLPSWASALHPGADSGEGIRSSITMIIGSGAIVGSLLSGLAISRLGRVGSLLLCFVAVLCISVPFYLWPSPSKSMMLGMTAGLGIFFGLSQAGLSLYIPELFPAVVRATSVGICFNAGRVLTSVAVLYVGVLASKLGGYQSALLVFTAPLVLGIYLTRIARESHPTEHHS